VDGARLADALDAALAGVVELGAAESGDKTMVDALQPAAAALRAAVERGAPLADALETAAHAAAEGARATAPMQARKGRASYLGERSIGHEDPGACSTALIVAALARALSA
jgi:dihydroxyacetone kinase-like protein